jgi:hypothetical protein
MTDTESPRPAVQIAGPATAEDVAAVVAVLIAAAGHDPEPPRAASSWAAPAARMSRPVDHGPAAWRMTYRR